MTPKEIKEKFIQGGELAIKRLIERKRLTNGYIVIAQGGKVIKVAARDIKL